MSGSAEQAAALRRVLVLALGNPDRGDDGIGVLVARQLAGRMPDGVALLTRASEMLSLIEEWSGFDAVACVDAAAPMGHPGRIHRIDLASSELPRDMSMTSSHAFGLADVVELARTLERAPRDIIVYAVEGGCFDRGAPMSAAVTAAAGEVAERVIAEVAGLRQR